MEKISVRYFNKQYDEYSTLQLRCQGNVKYLTQLQNSILCGKVKSFNVLTRKGLYTLHCSMAVRSLLSKGMPLIEVIFSQCRNLSTGNASILTLFERPRNFDEVSPSKTYRISIL